MNSIIKRLSLIVATSLLLASCIITNPTRENCEVKEVEIVNIYEGGVKDIVFAEENGDFYYINRGLEQGHTLDEMKEKVLNKKVTLHLAKVITGTSNHIAQLTVDGDVIFTEFD